MKELEYIFVHGAGGWGEYDSINRVLPYWGMFGHPLMKFLNRRGFDCHAASVDPSGNIHVRACELYAQLSGTRTDYGKAYSEAYGIERFGEDYTGRALIDSFDENTRLVLIGHSMGGGTVRLLARYMQSGNEKERSVTAKEDLSALFKGGMGSRIFSIVTLASPHNGSSGLDMQTDPDFGIEKVSTPLWSRITMRLLSLRLKGAKMQKHPKRTSNVDFTMAKNRQIGVLDHVYYFSIACSSTEEREDGTHYPSKEKTEILYFERSVQIGAYSGITPEGFVLDESWRENDGLVNTVSARYPLCDPHQPLDKDHIEKGIWNVMPDYQGDHMSVQGGFFIINDVRWYYLNLLGMIERLYAAES